MKKIIVLILVLATALSIIACNNTPPATSGKTDPVETPAETPAESPDETPAETPKETPAETKDEAKLDSPIDLLGIKVVIPATADRHVKYAYDAFINGVRRMTSSEITLSTAEQEIEILIGNTGRPETETLKATLGEDEYAVKLMGKKLVVVATDDAFLYEAVVALLDFMRIEDNADVAEGKLTLKRAIDVKQAGNKESYVYLFSKSDTISAQGKIYNTFNVPDKDIRACQGGCIANGYYYQGYIWRDKGDESTNKVIIVKYDFEKKTKVAQSEILSLNHCNDLTYNAELNLIAIINHGPNANLITFLDPDTLEIVRTQRINAHIYSLTYNYERDRYMTGLSGGQDLRSWFGDFSYDVKAKRIPATPKTVNYTTQGICSDENFVYCVLWDSKGYGTPKFQNVITVYDWYGNFVGIININVTKLEPENISIVDGTIYVTCHSSTGARVFRMKIGE